MSFLGAPYTVDVFVSYAHGPPGSNWLEYSQELIGDIHAELLSYPQLPRLRMFWDQGTETEHLVANRHLEPQLETGARNAGLFLALVSEFYLRSKKWCPAERAWWFEEQRKHQRSTDGRVAAVAIWNPTDTWPPEFCDSRGERLLTVPFHDRGTTKQHPYGWHIPSASVTEKEYRNAVNLLASAIAKQLEAFATQLELDRERARHADKLASDPLIYLYARADRATEWDAVRQPLEALNIGVVPSALTAEATGAAEYQAQRQRRIDTMTGADAVLLVGSPNLQEMEADLMTIGRLERHTAISRSERRLPCALVDLHGLGAPNPKLRANAARIGVDWIDATDPGWPARVKAWLAQAGAPPAPPAIAA